MHLGGGVGQPLDVDDPRPHVLALDRRLQRHQDVRALLQKIAELAQALLEQDRLVAARTGSESCTTPILPPLLRPPLIAVEHARPEPRGRGAGAHRAGEIGPARGPEAA